MLGHCQPHTVRMYLNRFLWSGRHQGEWDRNHLPPNGEPQSFESLFQAIQGLRDSGIRLEERRGSTEIRSSSYWYGVTVMALACMRMRFLGNPDSVLRSTSSVYTFAISWLNGLADLSGDLGNCVICVLNLTMLGISARLLYRFCAKSNFLDLLTNRRKGLGSPDDLILHCPLVA